MIQISWEQLAKNSESRDITFETFNYQVAYIKYANYGRFEYDYNSPGSEFYLTLNKDCDELSAKAGDVIGWQAKFWLNPSDMNNTSFDSRRRSELVKNLQTSLSHKPNLKTWIICTPGQPINTKPHRTKDKLVEELLEIFPNLSVIFWNKPSYESIMLEDVDKFLPVYSHYFSKEYVGTRFFKEYSEIRIKLLHEKYDIELYTEGSIDTAIYELINIDSLFVKSNDILEQLRHKRGEINKSQYFHIEDFNYYPHKLMNLLEELIEHELYVADSTYEIIVDREPMQTINKVLEHIDNQENLIKESIDTINELLGDQKILDKTKLDYKEQDCFNYLLKSVIDLRNLTSEYVKILNKILVRNIHIFARAGFGKTSFACSICNTMLSNNIPALFLLASEFRSNSIPIRKQIMSSLSLDSSFDFSGLLNILNNFGFLNNTKIPIIIDGLNETTPTAAIWHNELFYMVEEIGKYDHLILITTCRESYVEQIFVECKDYTDVENHFYLEGFDDNNIDTVIDRYFRKYEITVLNENFDKQMLRHPLMLKVFSIVNSGKKIVLDQSRLFDALDSYLVDSVERISTTNYAKNPLIESQIRKGISCFCQRLWDQNARAISYPNEFIDIFDPSESYITDFKITNSYKVLDEGIFLLRNMQELGETVEFTYDLLGGFCIAKNVFFNEKTSQDIIHFLSSDYVLNKLIGSCKTQVHPMAEDIIKSIIFLLPRYTGKQIFEIISNKVINKHVISMIELIAYTQEGKDRLHQYISNLDPNDPAIKQLLQKVMVESLSNNHERIDLLVDTILRMNSVQIDVNWSELVRKNSDKIDRYLTNIIDLSLNGAIDCNSAINYLYFTSMILSSTNRLLRDKATKALVLLGANHLDKYFTLLRKFERISDPYITERLLAALLGIITRTSDRELAIEIARYLERRYVLNIRTTHVLVLDYVDTILEFIKHKHGYDRICAKIDYSSPANWKKDANCLKELSSDASWGYGPVNTDFAKYVIGHLACDGYSFTDKTPNLRDCLAMVIWKMGEYGYSDEVFEEIDKEIAQSDLNYGIDKSKSTERYGKKYSWIAYFELHGYFLLMNMIKSDYENSHRVSSIDIDPTFPRKPQKHQLVTDCFLPRFNESTQNWINQERNSYLAEIYDVKLDDEEWILINSHLVQKNDDKIRMDVHVRTLLADVDYAVLLSEYIEANQYYHFRAPEFYYLFAGEIPWSKNIIYQNELAKINNKHIKIIYPFSWYSWESYHSQMNDIGSVPFISKELSKHLELTFNAYDFSYYTQDGQLATRYFWDDYSHYLFIRKDLLGKYCGDSKLALLWCESGTRYGEFGIRISKYEPPFKDFMSVKRLTL